MKTSNYILIGFLTFIILMLVGWHIDSSFHEEEFDKKQKAKSMFYNSRKQFEITKNDPDKLRDYIVNAEEYFKYYNKSHDYSHAADILSIQFRMFKDSSNFHLAKKWAKKAYNLKPKDRRVNEVYARTLENLGLDEQAKQYFDYVDKLDSIQGFKNVEYKNEQGHIIKVRRPVN